MIHYFCPDQDVKSGGIRQIYRHVQILCSHELPAYVLHSRQGFRIPDLPDVPIKYLEAGNQLKGGDFFIVPEGFPGVMAKIRDLPLRRFVFALSWSYIFPGLPNENWQQLGIERVITVSPFIAQVVEWSMGLPVDVLPFSINPDLYHLPLAEKKRKIVYFARKAKCITELRSILRCRNPEWLERIDWVALGDQTEEEYARELREAAIYLALGTEEGINQSVFEAMRCGALVAGFDGIGLHGTMIGLGPEQNCILAENGNYVSLAMELEPVLNSLLEGRMTDWDSLVQQGHALAAPLLPDHEEREVVDFWQRTLPQS